MYGKNADQWLIYEGAEKIGLLDFVIREEGIPTTNKAKALDQAADRLLGMAPVSARQPSTQKAAADLRPRLPSYNPQDKARGHDYLKARGIDETIIRKADTHHFLSYTNNAVVFVARDAEGNVRAAARRYYRPQPNPDNPDESVTKRDFRSSDKTYPLYLSGQNSNELHVVDGLVRRSQLTSSAQVHRLDREKIRTALDHMQFVGILA